MYLCFSSTPRSASIPMRFRAFIVFPVLAILGIFIFPVQPLLGQHHLMVIQMTLALTFIIQNLLLMTYGGQLLRIPSVVENSPWLIGDLVIRVSQLIAFGVSVLLAGLPFWVLNSTDFRPLGPRRQSAAEAAALMGINAQGHSAHRVCDRYRCSGNRRGAAAARHPHPAQPGLTSRC